MHRHTEEIRKRPVKEIMEKEFRTIHKDTKIGEIVKLFKEHEKECFPVVDDKDNLLGDVHERDMIKLAIDPSHLSEHDVTGYMGTKIDESFFAETAEDIMKKHEVKANPETPVEDVVLEMWKEDLGSVPVVEDGKLVGFIYERDIIDEVIEKLSGLK